MNSLIIAFTLLSPDSPRPSIDELMAKHRNMAELEDTQVKICVDNVCQEEYVPTKAEKLKSFFGSGALPTGPYTVTTMSENGEVVETPPTDPNPPLPKIAPQTEGSKGAENFGALGQIMGGLKSMSSFQGSVKVNYEYKNPKTGEEHKVNVEIQAATGSATGK